MDPAEPAPVVAAADANEARGPGMVVEQPPLRARDAPPVEVGGTTFLLAGVAASGVVGLSLFADDPLSRDVFLRISASAGRAPDGGPSTTWVGARLDTCYAVVGNYATGQGLRFGLCGGADVGLTLLGAGSQAGAPTSTQTFPFVALGPAAELGAELGPRATILLRVALGLSIARDSFVDGSGARVDPSSGTERAEVGLSWKLF